MMVLIFITCSKLIILLGSLWYHGHYSTDRGDGLLGGFVVMQKDQSVSWQFGQRIVPDQQYYVLLQDVQKLKQSENHLVSHSKV